VQWSEKAPWSSPSSNQPTTQTPVLSVLSHLLIVGVENSTVAAENTENAFREEFGGDAVMSE